MNRVSPGKSWLNRHRLRPAHDLPGQRTVEGIDWSAYDVVGFTSTFQQNVASLALARAIKEEHPRVTTLFGGANFDSVMGLEYLRVFPGTEQADNAVYWIGEAYYRQRRFRQAIAQFDEVLNRYPRSDKLPSAALKKGYAHLELGERSQGLVQLQYVEREYPNSDEANLARERLREIQNR